MSIASLIGVTSSIEKIDNETMPEAARLLNDFVVNAAKVADASTNNAAILAAQLLDGFGSQGDKMNDQATALLAPVLTFLAAWCKEVSRLNDNLERLTIAAPKP